MRKAKEKPSVNLNRWFRVLGAALLACLSAGSGFLQPSTAQQSADSSPRPSVENSVGELQKGDFRLNKHKLDLDQWPSGKFSFSVQNDKQEVFRQLNISDVQVTLDHVPINLSPDFLRLIESEPTSFLVVIDGSQSMQLQKQAAPQVINKLAAAKEAISTFLQHLRPNDTVAIDAFDKSLYEVTSPTTRLTPALADKVKRFNLRVGDESTRTDLYGATKEALIKAPKLKIRNLVILSDGMQDTVNSRGIRARSLSEFQSYKRAAEKDISDLAARSGVTIFTVPIGDRNSVPPEPDNLNYVDADTLCNISTRNTGLCLYVGIPELKEEAAKDPSKGLQGILEKKLKSLLDVINNSARYAYLLDVPLSSLPRDDRAHLLQISVRVGGNEFVVEYPMTWGRNNSIPTLGDPNILTKQLIELPKAMVTPGQLGWTYLVIFASLGFMALGPVVVERFKAAAQNRERRNALSRSVVVLKKGSNLIGYEYCPNHQNFPRPFVEGDVIVICPARDCGLPHHLGCWQFNKYRCMGWNCGAELAIPEELLPKHNLRQG